MKKKPPYKKAYFVGIKGVAMASLAGVYQDLRIKVAGSDTADDYPTSEVLSRLGIIPDIGFDPDKLLSYSPDVVVHTGAHGGSQNPQVVRALAAGIPVLPHARALGEVMTDYRQISVAGCHGKTTVTAMSAVIFSSGRTGPSYAVGCGWICGLGLPGKAGNGIWFIAEADEYVTDPGIDLTPRFVWQHPEILVVTNIAFDHPDVYRSLNDVYAAYRDFAARLKPESTLVYNGDDPLCRKLAEKVSSKTISVGFDRGNDRIISAVKSVGHINRFSISSAPDSKVDLEIQIPGRHNIQNAALAAVAALCAGLTPDNVRQGLKAFCGTRRRFENIGNLGKTDLYDDYAHHPDEIRATLEAARSWYPKGLILAVFQPHTYSRTKSLMGEFARSFDRADKVIISDIYASARERDTLGISGRLLAERTGQYHPDTIYLNGKAEIGQYINKSADKYRAIVFMGAGDIYLWARSIAGKL